MKVERKEKLLSIVVPAYKKGSTIARDLKNINSVLEQGLKDYDYEIICVVDGYLDNTYEEASKINLPKLKVIGYPENKGKGYAVRYGIARSKGDLVSFIDAGMEISPKSIMMLMAHMEWYNADIIVGSKRHPVSRVNYPLFRHITSIGYHFGVKMLFDLPVTDTQSGIKVFKREVLKKILNRLLVDKYAMDIEMLAVAKYLSFDRIYEAPIEVIFDQKTSAISWKVIFKMAWDTLAVFYRLRILHYYDDSNASRWQLNPELNFTSALR